MHSGSQQTVDNLSPSQLGSRLKQCSSSSNTTYSSSTEREFTHGIGVTDTAGWIQLNLNTVKTVEIEFWSLIDTAKKLCKTRTFISTSHKWFTLEITLELLHIYLHSSYRFLELVYVTSK